MAFAQDSLRILSGLYGLLRPLDLIQPYRLEMGAKFTPPKGGNLYGYWDKSLSKAINEALESQQDKTVINLASNEYFRAVKAKGLNAEVITPVFKDLKSGKYKVISFYAKRARGEMARYIIENEVEEVAALRKFKGGGYRYNKAESTARELVFTRDIPPSASK